MEETEISVDKRCIEYTSPWAGFELTVVIGTDCIGSYKSNYHAITTMTAPYQYILRHEELYIYLLLKLYFIIKTGIYKYTSFTVTK